jgi:hypothetical protein
MRKNLLTISAISALVALTACSGAGKGTDSGTGDPGALCVDGVGVLSGEYTEDLTLTADCSWLLSGGVLIGDDTNETVLTIEPGTTVYGESATNGFLVVRRGSKIVANGTADAPIVFTSDLPAGDRARGNWGGLVINGRAPINACADGTADCEAEGEGGTGKYGGTDPADSSGSLQYVRVEYGGTEISPDNEINGISFAGVGSGTAVDYVQVHANLDDGVEFFGGNVNVKHIVVSCGGDDGIDWDLGWQGKIQYALVAQCDDAGGYGIEADGNEADHTATPISNPMLSNLTFVGQPAVPEDNFGIVLRRGTGATIANTVVTGFPAGCLAIRDDATYGNLDSGDLALEHVLLGCDEPFEGDDADDILQEEDVFQAGAGNALVDPGLTDTALSADPDFRPTDGSPAASGGAAPSDSFFDSVSYLGAFDPAGSDWTDGWTQFSEN